MLEAFRTELQSYVKEPLTSKSLSQILQVASAARELLAVRNPKNRLRGRRGHSMQMSYGNSGAIMNPAYDTGYDDDDEEEGVGFQGTPGHMNVDRETFGARVLREIVAVIPQVLRASREDQTQIVQAVAAAEKLGMTELAESLKARLLPDAPATAPAASAPVAQLKQPSGREKEAIWAAKMPDSSAYVVGPDVLEVVKALAGPECDVVNVETGQIVRAAAQEGVTA